MIIYMKHEFVASLRNQSKSSPSEQQRYISPKNMVNVARCKWQKLWFAKERAQIWHIWLIIGYVGPPLLLIGIFRFGSALWFCLEIWQTTFTIWVSPRMFRKRHTKHSYYIIKSDKTTSTSKIIKKRCDIPKTVA